MLEAGNMEKGCKMLHSGHETSVEIIIPQQLKLPALGLHTIGSVISQSQIKEGFTRPYIFLLNYWPPFWWMDCHGLQLFTH